MFDARGEEGKKQEKQTKQKKTRDIALSVAVLIVYVMQHVWTIVFEQNVNIYSKSDLTNTSAQKVFWTSLKVSNNELLAILICLLSAEKKKQQKNNHIWVEF